MNFLAVHLDTNVAAAIAIICGAFISEDAATISAASLAAASILDARLSFLSAVTGLWVGDLGVFAAVRFWKGKTESTHWFLRATSSLQADPVKTNSDWPLALSRFLPGTRLPAYVSAGLNHMPFPRYAGITAATAAIWTAIVFAAVAFFPLHAQAASERLARLGASGLAIYGGLLLWRWQGPRLSSKFQYVWQRIVRWEFWPAWLFYAPVTAFCAWFGLRDRGLSLPTIANLNQKNGGIIGESKMEILRELMLTSPDSTAQAFLISQGRVDERLRRIQCLLETHKITFPFVLKPDTAQRGAGFRKLRSLADAASYLQLVSQPLVLQRYVEGPFEAGIFYYRFPGAPHGRIFGITRKRFPSITGDGIHSLEQLIAQDDRARFLLGVYLKRLGAVAARIPAIGEIVRLVEAGNHCQGCIFEDGRDLYSEDLRLAMDNISRQIPGFYVGRFDIRYTDDDSLRAGSGFQVIELNGAASEATNFYDARNSIWTAYRTLYRQWQLVYAIGAENRKRGATPRPVLAVWRDWREFSNRACEFPIAD